MTQRFLYILLGVALDKIPNTSKKKFCIRRLTLSILNLSSLILTKLQKSLTSIDSFKKVMARKDGKEGWQGRMTRKDDDFSPYTLIFLRTRLPIYSFLYALVFLRTRLPTHSSYRYVYISTGKTFRLSIYLRLSNCRGMQFVILDRRSSSKEVELLVGCNDAPLLCSNQPRHQY